MLHSPLALKVTVLIAGVLVGGFGASTVWTLQREREVLLRQSQRSARQLAASVLASIEGAMLQERPDVTRLVIEELRRSATVEELTVFRRNGVEAFTDLATVQEVQRYAELPREVLASIQRLHRAPTRTATGPAFARALGTGQPQEVLEEVDGRRLFSVYQPIVNQERCQGCHGTDHPIRAVVRVATSMEPVLAEVARQRNRQLLTAFLTIVAASAVLTVAMRRVVLRPVRALAVAARRVGGGDFQVRAPAGTRDELGHLAVAFNEMTEHLARVYAELEGRNAELAATLASLRESRQRVVLLEQLREQLARFVPESVTRLLEEDPQATELQKRIVEVSVLFLDIAGYTRLSEQLDPRRLNQLVQLYFASFLDIVREHHGDVNETAGDGLMVIFQADRPGVDHALNATQAAMAIRRRARALNEEYAGLFPAVELHMGINTGDALVGATKLGARWTFTATGPTTNLAARLAGIAGADEILVGPVTADRIRPHVVLESLGESTLKNVSQPVRVYRVVPPGVYERVTPVAPSP